MTDGLSLEVGAAGRVSIITVTGKVDVYSSPLLRTAIVNVVGANSKDDRRATWLVIELDVSAIDPTGLGVITSAVKNIRSQGGELVLAIGRPLIRRVFESTGLDRLIAIRETLEGAIAVLEEAQT